jgi:hypothetical protein
MKEIKINYKTQLSINILLKNEIEKTIIKKDTIK